MIVAGCQVDIAWEDKEANYQKVLELLLGNAPPKGSLIVLPEMFPTGFSMNVARIAESEERETDDFYSKLAQIHDCAVIGGMAAAGPDGKGRNEAAVFGPEGNEIARYCKIHPFTFGGEANYYACGEGIVTFEWGGFTVAPFICYDLRFPEIFRRAVLQGAELFVIIANWPQPREAHWITLLQARAIENQAYVVGVNRVGDDPNLSYSGRSLIIDPRGNVLADGGNEEGIIQAELDRENLLTYRKEFPALQDIHREFLSA